MGETQTKPRRFTPVLAPLLQSRKMAALMAVIAAAQLISTLRGWPGWPCPFLRSTGLPCPGCGLSRGCAALLRGQWHSAIRFHAFSPLFLAAIFLMALAAALPGAVTRRLVALVDRFERMTRFGPLILFALLFYWLARLCYHPLSLPR